MISEYCYDCMDRQIPMGQYPGEASMMQGYPMQGYTIQGGIQPNLQMSFPMQTTPGVGTAQMPIAQISSTGFQAEAGSPVQLDTNYTQGWLRTQIGKKVKVEFLIGTNMLIDREGTLLDVGISYILIRETETDDVLMADIYSIKFVKVFL